MSTAHTPGPWRVDRCDILTPDDHCLAEVYGGPCGSLAEAAANRRLIAAAPELLRVAALALEELEWLGQLSAYPVRAELRRAIAAATGASTPNTTDIQGA